MSQLLRKSEANISAAFLLNENKLSAPSVHCSYYACFQKLKYLIAQSYFCSYDELENQRNEMSKSYRKHIGVHEFFVNYKLSELIARENGDHRIINDFNQIRLFRIKSDYYNVPISEINSKFVMENAIQLIEKLDKIAQ